MSYGIIHLPWVAVRKEPDQRSEMCTQLLFGEKFLILESGTDWFFIQNLFDNYQGWISNNSFLPLSESVREELGKQQSLILSDTFLKVGHPGSDQPQLISAGSELDDYKKKEGTFRLGKNIIELIEIPEQLPAVNPEESVCRIARKFINVPYHWGGKSMFGTDCSGFVQTVYRINGIRLPRDAGLQIGQGETVNFLHDSRPGDLAFFDNEEGEIIHVGILLDRKTIIHASGQVRIDPVDHQGIFRQESDSYSHKLRLIRHIRQ